MPNLFSKITSQNGVLKLFSGGKQLKSLVPLLMLLDVLNSWKREMILKVKFLILQKILFQLKKLLRI